MTGPTREELARDYMREVAAAAARGEDVTRYVVAHLQAAGAITRMINPAAGELLQAKVEEAGAITAAAVAALKTRTSTVG